MSSSSSSSLRLRDMTALLHSGIKEESRSSSSVRSRHAGKVKGEPDLSSADGHGLDRPASPMYVASRDDVEDMSRMGLPTQFAHGTMMGNSGHRERRESVSSSASAFGTYIKEEVGRKGDKKAQYFCEVCELELNSHDTMTSHIKGVKHAKKTMLLEEKRAQAEEEGTYIPEKMVRQIAAAKPQPKKIPVRLQEKLRQDNEPIVGLAFVEEVLACSNIEMEPHYECHLCGNTGGSNGMRAHILGRPHREKFLQHLHPDDPRYLEMSKSALLSAVSRLRENDRTGCIQTVYSEELYPWPAGKAPWSLEQGGMGIAPTASVYELNRKIRKEAILKGKTVEELTYNLGRRDDDDIMEVNADGALVDRMPSSSTSSLSNGQLPDPSLVRTVSGQRQMQDYYALAMELVNKAAEFHSANAASPAQRERTEALAAMLQSNLVAVTNVPVRDSAAFGRTRRDSGGIAEASSSHHHDRRQPTTSSSSSSSYNNHHSSPSSRLGPPPPKRERTEDDWAVAPSSSSSSSSRYNHHSHSHSYSHSHSHSRHHSSPDYSPSPSESSSSRRMRREEEHYHSRSSSSYVKREDGSYRQSSSSSSGYRDREDYRGRNSYY